MPKCSLLLGKKVMLMNRYTVLEEVEEDVLENNEQGAPVLKLL